MSYSVWPHRLSPPGSPIPGILQARTLEWVAISFNAWKWEVKVKSLSCVRLLATPWTATYQAPLFMGFSSQEYWSGWPLPSLHGLWVGFYIFFSFIFISWRLITLQYCSGFCHTLTWISHGFTCIPHPDPPSHLLLDPIPLALPSAPGPSTCFMHPTWAGDLFHYR